MSERSIFLTALDIVDPAQRSAYLDQACGSDAALRNHIEELIAAEPKLGGFLAQPHAAVDVTSDVAPITERPGTLIGPYKLLQQIGEGGFGVVYMAEQQRPVRRKVALKIIKPGMDTKEVIARFESERQALALMDHPNIARVLDGGTTESGRPYFVMELVKGIPLTQFCDDNKLDMRQRLTLFSAVCKAIQHAHHKGVIHRDIKPTNVMVTLHDGQPVPKVIDFGVSKAISQQLTEKTMFTAYGQMIGTPAYMSPEQAEMSGLDIDTRSDVYSLGVLLYELLTGSTPLEAKSLRGKAYAELQRMIREDEPPRPSMRVSTQGEATALIAAQRGTGPRELGALLRGELDWIVMKALEKNRDRRYESANTFAADVERYLRHEAVEACPPSALYRLRKFIRRNRVACTTGTLVALSLLGGILISTMAARDALYQRRLAEDSLRVAFADRQAAEQAQKNTVVALQAAEHERDRAEKSKHEESNQRLLAEQRETEAKSARQAEAEQRQSAEQERDKAQALSAAMEKQKEQQRRMLYVAQMNLIQKAWEGDNVARVQELLQASRPRPDETDLRGIEWQYWQRMLHQEERAFKLPVRLEPGGRGRGGPGFAAVDTSAASSMTFSHDGTRLAAIVPAVGGAQAGEVLNVWNTDTGSEEPIWTRILERVPAAATGPGTAPSGRGSVPPTSNYRISFLDAERVVIARSKPRSAAETQTLSDILRRLPNATPEEAEKLKEELARRREQNPSELQAFRLDSRAGSVPAQAQPPITVDAGYAFNRDGSRIATIVSLPKEGESQQQPMIVILDGRTGAQLEQLPSPFRLARVLALSPDATRFAITQPTLGLPDTGARVSAPPITIMEVATRKSVTVSLLSANSNSFGPPGPTMGEFTPDGTRFALFRQSGPANRAVTLIDVATGNELFTISTDRLPVRIGFYSDWNFFIFSPDGKWLVSNWSVDAATHKLMVWDAATGKPGPEFKGHTSVPVRAAFSADSKRLLAADENGTVKVWRLTPEAPSSPTEAVSRRAGLGNLGSAPDVIATSFDRRWTASAPRAPSGGGGRTTAPEPPFEVKLEDASGRVPSQTLSLGGPVETLVFSRDGAFLAAVSIDEAAKLAEAAELRVWSVATGKLALSPPLRFAATEGTGTIGGGFRGGPAPAQQTVYKYRVSSTVPVFSPDSRRLAIASGEQPAIRLWDLGAGRELPVALARPLRSFPPSAIFSPDSKLLLIGEIRRPTRFPAGSPSNGVQIHDASTGAPRWAEDSPVASAVFSADGSRLAGIRRPADAGGDSPSATVVVWDAATGEEVGSLQLPPNRVVLELAVSNNGRHVATTGPSSVTVYDMATATELHTLDGGFGNVWFTADGQRVISSPGTGSVLGPFVESASRRETKVWDAVTGQELLSVSAESPLFTALVPGRTTEFAQLSAQVEAEGLVDWLTAADADGRYLTRGQIAERIKADPSLSDNVRTIALKLAANKRRSGSALNTQALTILRSPSQSRDEYQRALDWISEALEQAKENTSYLAYQGIAFYRLGQYADALTALERSRRLREAAGGQLIPAGLSFLAMTHHQLGHVDEARQCFYQADRAVYATSRPGGEFGQSSAGSMFPGGSFGSQAIPTFSSADTQNSLTEATALVGLRPPSDLIASGNVAREKKEYDQALAAYSEAIALDPQNPWAYLERSHVWQQKLDYDKAIADCDAAVRLDPRSATAHNLRGIGWDRKREYDKAIQDYDEALKIEPRNPVYPGNRASVHRKLGELGKALADYNRAIALSSGPAAATYYRYRGEFWIEMQEYDLAIKDFSEALNLNPALTVAYNNRGHCWLRKGDYDKAIEDLTEAIRQVPKAPEHFTNRGGARTMKGQYQEALADLEEAHQLNPKLPAVYFWRGFLWEKQGQNDKAAQEYDAFVRLSPKPTDGFLDRANRWTWYHEYDKAIADYSALIALDPENAQAFCRRGLVWVAKSDYDKAIQDFEQAIRVAPALADGYQASAWLRATCPEVRYVDGKAAVESAAKACELSHGNNWTHLDTLAAAYAAADNFAEAINQEEKALTLLVGVRKADFESRLALYHEGKPYRELPKAKPAAD